MKFSSLLGVFINRKSLILEISHFLSEIRKFYETYLSKIVYVNEKKNIQKQNLIKIQDCLIKNILIRYLKKKMMYNAKKKKTNVFKKINFLSLFIIIFN